MDLHMLPIIGLDQKALITFRAFVVYVFVLIPMDIQLLLVHKGLVTLAALVSSIICRMKTGHFNQNMRSNRPPNAEHSTTKWLHFRQPITLMLPHVLA